MCRSSYRFTNTFSAFARVTTKTKTYAFAIFEGVSEGTFGDFEEKPRQDATKILDIGGFTQRPEISWDWSLAKVSGFSALCTL